MDLPQNAFKKSLHAAEPSFGIWASLASAYACEVVATTGYDWMLIDGEHGPNTVTTILGQLQAVAPYPIHPVVRSVDGNPALIKQLLDIGVQTLMVPMVESGEQAQALVAATRYPPEGIRGMGGSLTRATRWGAIPEYIRNAHRELCLIVQIESRSGAQNAAAIAATPGVDAVFIGPIDLATSMGHAGDASHAEVQACIQSIIDTCKSVKTPCGILAPRPDDARRYIQAGCSFVAVGLDLVLLRSAAIEHLAKLK